MPAWPASTAMATLVSRATLLPLTRIDAFELPLDDLPHFTCVVQGDTARQIGERQVRFDFGSGLRRLLQGKRFQIKSKTMRKDSVELAIEVEVKKNNTTFMDAIKALPSVQDVSLIQFAGEYNG